MSNDKSLPLPDFFPTEATGANRRLHYQANPAIAALGPDFAPYGTPGLLEQGIDWAFAESLAFGRVLRPFPSHPLAA